MRLFRVPRSVTVRGVRDPALECRTPARTTRPTAVIATLRAMLRGPATADPACGGAFAAGMLCGIVHGGR